MDHIRKQMNSNATSGCCGSFKRKKVATVKEQIPHNPTIKNGVSLIYVGAGTAKFKGEWSQTEYYVSDHHRHFKVYKEDLDAILKNSTVILKP